MPTDVFTAIAEPHRRAILDQLRAGPASVGELVDRMGLPQPTVSKHLRVLRDHRIVSCRTAAQSRIYQLNTEPLAELDDWLQPYRLLWQRSFAALGDHLDRTDEKRTR
ncbi:ArsR/SmtB family transcription factor [Microlunatus soli]|uniref:DNA-binding transcriptional regulator, ArsR family n=1 Tax=Microlunatus soli TaxID=630515 RepID=A0A1H1QFA5_9ACTN|nr:metalloregulator ArsR/SmtB family transcription factor [Microlunatus soli]SDS21993.1 DNA-binding transcriptional regulator, ArsR family [Microlunatus soli]